jgi:hypothetical protein
VASVLSRATAIGLTSEALEGLTPKVEEAIQIRLAHIVNGGYDRPTVVTPPPSVMLHRGELEARLRHEGYVDYYVELDAQVCARAPPLPADDREKLVAVCELAHTATIRSPRRSTSSA